MRRHFMYFWSAIALMGLLACVGENSEIDGGYLDRTNIEESDLPKEEDGGLERSPGDIPSPESCNFTGVPYDPQLGKILEVVSEDVETCARMEREILAEPPPVGGITVNFKAVALTVGHAGSYVEITDPEALSYQVTLHNWYDKVEGTQGGVVYAFDIAVDNQDWSTFHFFITASDELTQEVLWGPVECVPWEEN